MKSKKPSVDEILKKYGAKIENQVKTDSVDVKKFSKSYLKFKSEMSSTFSSYEKWCHTLGSFIRIKPSKKDEEKMSKALSFAHVDVEPWQAIGLGITGFISIFFLGFLSSFAIALIKANPAKGGALASFPLLFFFLMVILSVFVFYYAQNYPERLGNLWRLKASSQMVPAILYIVVYMRHTPNLEKAISFAAEHLDPPLSLDFRKIFYNVEIGRYSTIKESLGRYLEGWRNYSPEFVEGFHLIESSLFEPEESRRIDTLEKGLQVVLDGVYDKMLKFSHDVKAPLTNVYMLGVVMPTLALALIPLASSMLGGMIKASHVFVLFNLIIPFLVLFLTDKLLILRPGGHGNSNFLERNPYYSTFSSNKPYRKAFLKVLPLLIIGLIPLIFQFTPLPALLGLQKDYLLSKIGLGFLGSGSLFGFTTGPTGVIGPFGLGAVILGSFFPLGIALFFSLAYKEKTKLLIVEREKTNQLEKEFNNSLFQLGNRLGNGVPPELVFAKVAEANKGLRSGEFFNRVNYNIQQGGMGVESAIFDKNRGAIRFFPSQLIATSMKILIESAKKGLKIAAVSLMSISEYMKNLDKITSRLKDLLAEVISDMKSNMTFLAPLLSGIVVGLATMITLILSKLNLANLSGSLQNTSIGSLKSFARIFNYQSMISPYYLQISVGLYLIEIIFILTSTLVTIDSGEDKLEKAYKTGMNLSSGIKLFFITALFATIALGILAATVLGPSLG